MHLSKLTLVLSSIAYVSAIGRIKVFPNGSYIEEEIGRIEKTNDKIEALDEKNSQVFIVEFDQDGKPINSTALNAYNHQENHQLTFDDYYARLIGEIQKRDKDKSVPVDTTHEEDEIPIEAENSLHNVFAGAFKYLNNLKSIGQSVLNAATSSSSISENCNSWSENYKFVNEKGVPTYYLVGISPFKCDANVDKCEDQVPSIPVDQVREVYETEIKRHLKENSFCVVTKGQSWRASIRFLRFNPAGWTDNLWKVECERSC